MTTKVPPVLALHATSRGFGYVVFEGPMSPYDWGVVGAKGDKNAQCLRKIELMFERFSPDTLLLEEAASVANRSGRIAKLYAATASMAASRGIEVVIYRFSQIRACFAAVGACTRQQIAEAVGRHIDAFRHRMPKPRKPWQAQDRRMSLFCAAALVITHYRYAGR